MADTTQTIMEQAQTQFTESITKNHVDFVKSILYSKSVAETNIAHAQKVLDLASSAQTEDDWRNVQDTWYKHAF
jgi:hypothetical protein